MTVQEIAAWLHGEVIGDGTAPINRVAKIEEADRQSISFLANPKYERYLETTQAGAVLISRQYDRSKLPHRPEVAFVLVDDPYIAFVKAHKQLTPSIEPLPSGIHPSAIISETAKLGKDVSIGANAVIGDGAVIGDRSKIFPCCVIGIDAQVGVDCLLYPNVTVYHQCRLGNRVILHAGVVIGGDGFGFAPKQGSPFEKIPQLGIVVVGDDVEMGANTTVDRATIGETIIESGVKLDNMVQVGHNCVIGENTVIAAQTGISGSVKIGKNCMIGGQVGISGHLVIADRVTILAQSGIAKSIEEPGSIYFGTPAKERMRAHRIEAVIRSLPELNQEVSRLQKELESLRKELKEQKSSH